MTLLMLGDPVRGPASSPLRVEVYIDTITRAAGEPTWTINEAPSAHVKPHSIRWGRDGEPSTFRFAYGIDDVNTDARPGTEIISMGARIRVNHYVGDEAFELFVGYIVRDSWLIQSAPDVEAVEYVASGPEILLQTRVVAAATYMTADYMDSIAAAYAHTLDWAYDVQHIVGEVIMNPAGKGGNCSTEDTTGLSVFMDPGQYIKATAGTVKMTARHWTAYAAIHWLLKQYADDVWEPAGGFTFSVSLAAHKTALEALPLGEINLTGMTVTEALRAILSPVGWGYSISPWTVDSPAAHQVLIFPLLGADPQPGPMLADRLNSVTSSSAAGQTMQVQRIQYSRDVSRLSNDITVIGDRTRIEVSPIWDEGVGDLAPYWLNTDDDLTDYDVSNVIKAPTDWTPDLYKTFQGKYRFRGGTNLHAMRSFAWHTGGSLRPTVDGIVATDTETPVRRPRPLRESIEWADTNETNHKRARLQIGVLVSGTIDAASWIDVPSRAWADHAGATITVDDLVGWHPYSPQSLKGKASAATTLHALYGDDSYLQLLFNTLYTQGTHRLEVRLVGSVQGDLVVKGGSAYVDTSVWPIKTPRVIFAPNRFVRRINEGDASDGDCDLIDNETTADTYADAIKANANRAIGHGSIILRGLDLSYRPGDVLDGTRGYVRNLFTDEVGAAHPTIRSITWQLHESGPQTELALDTESLKVMR